jgi:hypothetical protein
MKKGKIKITEMKTPFFSRKYSDLGGSIMLFFIGPCFIGYFIFTLYNKSVAIDFVACGLILCYLLARRMVKTFDFFDDYIKISFPLRKQTSESFSFLIKYDNIKSVHYYHWEAKYTHSIITINYEGVESNKIKKIACNVSNNYENVKSLLKQLKSKELEITIQSNFLKDNFLLD